MILPDSGRGYLAKIFNDQWMRSYGFLASGDESSVGEILKAKTGELPDLVHIHPNESVRDVINIMNEYGVSHIPVLSQEPPVVMGEVLGAVDERTLTAKLFRGEANSRTRSPNTWRPGSRSSVRSNRSRRPANSSPTLTPSW